MLKPKIRGPYNINQLSSITGLSLEALRQYQRDGVIPKMRAWGLQEPSEVFYKVDIDKLLMEESKKQDAPGRRENAVGTDELTRKINRLINIHMRLYPAASKSDIIGVLHNTSLKYVSQGR